MRFEIHAQFADGINRYWKARDFHFSDSYWILDIGDNTVVNISDQRLLCIIIRDLENHPKEDVMIDEHKAIQDLGEAFQRGIHDGLI